MHGTRAFYRHGCRCLPCARAEALYRRHRVERVDATPARSHLEQLAAHGVGLLQASRLSGLSRSTLQSLRSGRSRTVDPMLLAAVLTIPGIPAPGSRIKAWPTRRLLAWFRLEGFTDAELARRLGMRTPHVQIVSPCCYVRTAARVRALYRKVAQI